MNCFKVNFIVFFFINVTVVFSQNITVPISLNLLFSGKYDESKKALEKERTNAKTTFNLFQYYLNKAEYDFHNAYIEDFKLDTDTALLFLNKTYKTETIYHAEIYTNYCRYNSYHTFGLQAYNSGIKARALYYKFKNESYKIRDFLIFQSLGTAMRNYGVTETLFPKFDTAFYLYNTSHKTLDYYGAMLYKSYGNACMDRARNPKTLPNYYSAETIKSFSKSMDIIKNKYPNNYHDVAHLYMLQGLYYFYLSDFKNSDLCYDKADNNFNALKKINNLQGSEALYLVSQNWHSWTIDSLYNKTNQLALIEKQLIRLTHAEELFTNYAKKNIYCTSKTFRDVYTASPYFNLINLLYRYNYIKPSNDNVYKLIQYVEKSKTWNEFNNETIKDFNKKYKLPEFNIPTLLDTIQGRLTNKQAIIEYFIINKSSYAETFAIVITKKNVQFIRLHNSFNENYLIFQNQINKTNTERYYYQNRYFRFYNYLFKDIESSFSKEINDITIIPAGAIGQISFEAMLRDTLETQYSKMNVLFKDYTFHYQSSLYKIKPQKTDTIQTALFISPIYDNIHVTNLLQLNHFDDELSEKLNAHLIRHDPVKKNILNNITSPDLLQFTGHTSTFNYDLSYCKFWLKNDSNNNNVIKYSDFNKLSYNAKLIVYNSCEGSKGDDHNTGEITSIASSFLNCGAKCVVSTAFKLNQKSTTYILKEFYANLYKGQQKHIALKNAKRAYLAQCKTNEEAFPLNWATLMVSGDVSPLYFTANNKKSDNTYYYITTIIGLFIFSLWLYIKRRN